MCNADTWVDDISLDFQGENPQVVANHALEGFHALARLLGHKGLEISVAKTGFLCSHRLVKQELQKLRHPADPPVNDVMKDLGVDSAAGHLRRVKIQKQRFSKGGPRAKKLEALKVSRPHLPKPELGL